MPTQYGLVTDDGLNLREQPSITSDKLTRIPNNTTITVVDYNDDWYSTTYATYTGYVMKQYITLITPPVSGWQYGHVTSNSLNVRKAPGTSVALWNNVWPINRIALIKPSETGWYETLYRGEAAFVSASHIEPMTHPTVPDSIVARMMYMAVPELGRNKAVCFNGYGGEWCHRFADWLTMHAAQPKVMIPNTSNCGTGIVWFVNNMQSGGFFFKNLEHKARMIHAYPAIDHLSPSLSDTEVAYVPVPGDYIYFRWRNATASVNVNHVGIVRTVTDTTLTTFEGNSGNRVISREFTLNDVRIVGYGKPTYIS